MMTGLTGAVKASGYGPRSFALPAQGLDRRCPGRMAIGSTRDTFSSQTAIPEVSRNASCDHVLVVVRVAGFCSVS